MHIFVGIVAVVATTGIVDVKIPIGVEGHTGADAKVAEVVHGTGVAVIAGCRIERIFAAGGPNANIVRAGIGVVTIDVLAAETMIRALNTVAGLGDNILEPHTQASQGYKNEHQDDSVPAHPATPVLTRRHGMWQYRSHDPTHHSPCGFLRLFFHTAAGYEISMATQRWMGRAGRMRRWVKRREQRIDKASSSYRADRNR